MWPGLSKPRQPVDSGSVCLPFSVANSGLSLAPDLCISPQQLTLDPVVPSSNSPSLASDPPPQASRATSQASFGSSSPPELSKSPPATTASHSHARASPSRPRPLTCHHCHNHHADVAALVDHIMRSHWSGRGHLFCGRDGCKHHATKRSLERHLHDSKHHLGALYVCRCGQDDRKDKHRAHLRVCAHPGGLPYVCMCGKEVDSTSPGGLELHQAHFEACGKGKRGRPRRNPAATTT